MNSRSWKLKIFDGVFLLCFFVYAVSPLTYSAPGTEKKHESSCSVQGHGVSLYIVKLLLSTLIVQEDQDDLDELDAREATPSAHILLRKKRAVLSSKDLNALMQAQALEVLVLTALFPENAAVLVGTVSHDQSNPYRYDGLSLRSGNSPPAA
jgi:hypothetical protein